PSKQVAWQYNSKRGLTDAQQMGRERVMVAEGRTLFERDLKGNSYWEKELYDGILGFERLPGGDIFVATRRQLYVLDPVGIVVFSPKVQKVEKIDDDTDPSELITVRGAGRARDGHMVYIKEGGECVWLDPEGLVTRSFPLGDLGQNGVGLID